MTYQNFKKSPKTPDAARKASNTKQAIKDGYKIPKKRGPKRSVGY